MKLRYLAIFFLLLRWTDCLPQTSFRFRHVGVENGLSQGSTYHIIKDSRGYMWLGSQDGINRFDGKNIEVYLSGASGQSTNVQGIAEDTAGNLWVGSHKGLYQYIRKKNAFVKPALKNGPDNRSIHVFSNHKKSIFLLTEQGLSQIIGNEVKLLTRQITYNRSQINNFVKEAANGDFWFLDVKNGLSRYAFKTGKVSRYFSAGDGNVFGLPSTFNCISTDKTGNIWLGRGNELIRFNHQTLETENYTSCLELNKNTIFDIARDGDSNLWLATEGNGIVIFDPVKRKIVQHLKHEDDIPNSLRFNEVSTLFIDENNDVFANTDPQGLDIITAVPSAFKYYSFGKNKKFSLSGYSVRGIVEDKDSTIWIGTELAGLNRLNPQTGQIKQYSSNNGLPGSSIRYVYKDPLNRIWVSTESGIAFFSTAQDRLEKVPLPFNCEITNILYVENGVLLLSTDKGLILLNTENKKIISHSYRTLVGGYASFKDKTSGLIYVSNRYRGIQVFKLVNGELRIVKKLLPDFHVLHTYTDSKYMWAATDRGLVKWNIKNNKVEKTYGVSDGLHHEYIYSVLSDLNGNLWLSTNRGLSRFNPHSERFEFIKEISPREYNSRSSLVTRSGDLYFGSTTGLDRIQPKLLTLRTDHVGVQLTGIEYDHHQGVKDSAYVGELSQITLPFNSNTITIRYTATDYRGEGLNRYRYFLKGYDEDTIYSGTVDQVRYAQLPSGKYEFFLQASDLGGNWASPVKNLMIIVQPPFWQTWWFILMLCIFIVTLVTFSVSRYLDIRLNAQSLESNKKIALEKERSRIARDMNDSLGSELFGLKLLGQVALSQSSKEDANSYIQKIVDASKGISEKISEVIWVTDSDQDNAESLWNYIQKNAQIYLKPSGIIYRFDTLPSERLISISGERRHEILNFNRQLFLELTKACDFPQCKISFQIQESSLVIFLQNVDLSQMDKALNANLEKLQGKLNVNADHEVRIQIPLNN
ncbi:ligand-binding sensor domain-containing protein [Dyadobacter psychrotolerans]|uniref:Two component regulator three Y domain-containing protein n=1 Tax=Dyadobacter psychrotolerans TaxID=2541721 RepID=A0A4R5E1B7_9BACT|nr:sensor histidine kinase [Dyadobacter psychrotolerans]TDE17523.1 hypothetical protein E0F88_06430 [Dyadobacter psychrotolerans]